MTGFIETNTDTYAVTPLAEGLHAITAVDRSKIPPDHDPRQPPPPRPDMRGMAPNSAANILDTAVTQVVVFVAYTAAARQAYEGNMQGLAQAAIDDANEIYSASKADTSLRLVGTMEVAYPEPATQAQALVDLTSGTGNLANIRARREATAADVVVMLSNIGNECGRADPVANPDNPYAVVNWKCITVKNYSFAHEIGHVFGADHDLAHQTDRLCAIRAWARQWI
jgi:peptidyl-Asp metalloendopeptidase